MAEAIVERVEDSLRLRLDAWLRVMRGGKGRSSDANRRAIRASKSGINALAWVARSIEVNTAVTGLRRGAMSHRG